MIEAIREIGEYANARSGNNTLLENFSKKIPSENKNKKGQLVKQHIVVFNFDLDNQMIICNFEKVKEDSGRKYLWLGNNPGNKPQIYFTSNLFSFIFGDSLSNILGKVSEPLRSELQKIIDTFFERNEGFYRVKYNKFTCLDNEKRLLLAEKIKKNETDLSNEKPKEKAKKLSKKYLEDLNKIVLNSLKPSLEIDEVSVYSLKLNDSLLIKREEYRKMLQIEKLDSLFDPKNKAYKKNLTPRGNCSLCNKKEISTTSNATNLSFKFYMTDKVGFSSDLDGKFTKNFNICQKCYADLLSGERFTDNNLKTYLGGISCYMIPTLLFNNPDLDYVKFSQYVTHKNNALSNLINLRKFEEKMKEFREFEDDKNNFVINYLFYRKGKSDFKILKLIKDVPPSRLDAIFSVELELSNLIKERYNNQWNFHINLRSIGKIIPLGLPDRKTKKVPLYSNYLDILDAIFSNKKIDYHSLIAQFSEVVKIIHFERAGYTVSTKSNLEFKIMQLNFALKFFNKLDLLKGIYMEDSPAVKSVPDDITQFWDAIGLYDDHRKALFLLGVLIGNVGNKQFKAGHKTKPILNKINFNGMNIQAIIRLTNEVFEKMIQYKILKYNESLFHQYKKIIDTHNQRWSLNNQENVFYLLSGYSFTTYQAISKGEIEVPREEESEEGGDENE